MVPLLPIFFFFKQKTAYEIRLSLVGSEMCIRDRRYLNPNSTRNKASKSSLPRDEKRRFPQSGGRRAPEAPKNNGNSRRHYARGRPKKRQKALAAPFARTYRKSNGKRSVGTFSRNVPKKSPTAYFVGKYYISNEERQTRQIMQEGIRLAAQPATAVTVLTMKL